ncbi:hypothetical protein AMJ85_05735 [candidate division BRC1 bacterium SM23_51]|nr:MAG: hypothetical protein AMJ85_05735 [candidate division BRC1 bacterium SM23_51]
MAQQYLSAEHREELERLAERYPRRRSLALPAIWAVQRTWGRVSREAMEEVAEVVGITPAEVREIVTFYSMFHEKPVGRYVLAVCGTLSCAVCGGEGLIGYLEEKLGIKPGETTEDGLFTLEVVECLGACAWGPAMLVNDRLQVRLTRSKVDEILAQCKSNGGKHL